MLVLCRHSSLRAIKDAHVLGAKPVFEKHDYKKMWGWSAGAGPAETVEEGHAELADQAEAHAQEPSLQLDVPAADQVQHATCYTPVLKQGHFTTTLAAPGRCCIHQYLVAKQGI